jgi:hypothetical protein
MKPVRKTKLLGCSLAACLAAAGLALAAEGGIAKDAFKAAQERIEAQATAQHKACSRWQGNARDVCEAQAKGREKTAKAELQAHYRPSPEAEKLAKTARAEADYEVAKARCAALKDDAKDRCVQQAKHDREAAIRLAKVEKVQELNAQKRADEQRLHAQPKAASAAPKS